MPDPNATNVGGVGGLFASIFDLINASRGQGTNRGNTAAAMSDPFMGQREGYQKQLLGLLTDPSSFKMDPGAVFARDQGLEGVARFGNSMFGTTRSGNTADTLNRDATGYAAQQFNKRIDQLMTLSGATTGSPAAAGEQYIRGNQANDQGFASGAAGLNTLLSLLGGSGAGGVGGVADLIRRALTGGGGGGSLNADGTINWGSTGTGTGDQGGFVGGDGTYTPDPTTQPIDFGGGGGIEDPWATEPGFGDGGFDFGNIDWSNWG
jgi:hypothetical protein